MPEKEKKMNNYWVVSIKEKRDEFDTKNTACFVYNEFAGARAKMREIMKDLAFGENEFFDGKGNLKYFTQYVKNHFHESADDHEFPLTKETAMIICGMLADMFRGKDVKITDRIKLSDYKYDDFVGNSVWIAHHYRVYSENKPRKKIPFVIFRNDDIDAEFTNKAMYVVGVSDRNPFSGKILTNALDMSEEGDYFFESQNGFCSESGETIIIELTKSLNSSPVETEAGAEKDEAADDKEVDEAANELFDKYEKALRKLAK